MASLKFTKMQGLGNDFVVIDGATRPIAMTSGLARKLADRHFGVGCDQVLLVERSTIADFKYRIWNQDGGEVEQCGNGARCFAKFVQNKGLTRKSLISVETKTGIIALKLDESGMVTVDMGTPIFDPKRIPFTGTAAIVQDIDIDGAKVQITALSMGNPHAVQVVADVDTAPVGLQGPRMEHHKLFPERVNAGYMQIIDRGHIRLRVWERGAGETLACGTGACAAVVAGIKRDLLRSPVEVSMKGGTLSIAWDGAGAVTMTGPAETVFEGEVSL